MGTLGAEPGQNNIRAVVGAGMRATTGRLRGRQS